MRLYFKVKISIYVTFASRYCPCNFLQRAWSCRLKSLAAWLCELTHPSSSSFDGSVPNLATFCGKHPKGPVLCIQKYLAPWSYSFWKNSNLCLVNCQWMKIIILFSKWLMTLTFIPASNSTKIVGIEPSIWSNDLE